MNLKSINDKSFKKYGKILTNYDVSKMIEIMDNTSIPEEVIYNPSSENLEDLPVFEDFQKYGFGGLPIQIGYCTGNNNSLNALEYHRSSEINVAATDVILMLGLEQDITSDFTYDTSLIETFFVPKGTVLEIYATTLHYAPCTFGDSKGFRWIVILPKETNTPLTFSSDFNGEPQLLIAKNKWLIAHKDACIEDALCGLIGENLTITP